LRSKISECSKYGYNLKLHASFDGSLGLDSPGSFGNSRSGHNVIFGNANGDAGETVGNVSLVDPLNGDPTTLAHELGHQGGYYNADQPYLEGPDNNGHWSWDHSHSGDRNDLMYKYNFNGGQIDKCWCKAMSKLSN